MSSAGREKDPELPPPSWEYKDAWGGAGLGLDDVMAQIGDNRFADHHDLEAVRQEKLRSAAVLQSRLEVRPHEVGVEIGSGLGIHTAYFAERCARVYTVDVTRGFEEHFARNCGPRPNVVRIVSEFFPVMGAIPDGTLDFAFSSAVFCHLHVYDVYLYFEELSAKLKPGGRFYVNLQSADQMDFGPFFLQFLEAYRGQGRFTPIHPGQMQFHSSEYFRRLGRRFGLEVDHELLAGTYAEFVFRRVTR